MVRMKRRPWKWWYVNAALNKQRKKNVGDDQIDMMTYFNQLVNNHGFFMIVLWILRMLNGLWIWIRFDLYEICSSRYGCMSGFAAWMSPRGLPPRGRRASRRRGSCRLRRVIAECGSALYGGCDSACDCCDRSVFCLPFTSDKFLFLIVYRLKHPHC